PKPPRNGPRVASPLGVGRPPSRLATHLAAPLRRATAFPFFPRRPRDPQTPRPQPLCETGVQFRVGSRLVLLLSSVTVMTGHAASPVAHHNPGALRDIGRPRPRRATWPVAVARRRVAAAGASASSGCA